MGVQSTLSRPVSDADPFSHEFLTDPYPHHEALREAGPVVWLAHYGIWAMARHQQVRDALTDWQTYCSSAGVGLSDFRKEPPWRPPSIILEADPPLHTRTRAVLTRILSPAAIKVLRETFEREAEVLIARLVEQREFDGVADLAEAYPVKVFPDAVGISEEGRENLLPYGSMVFNSFGPRNDLFQRAMANAGPVRDWIMSKCSRAALAPGQLGMQIFEAVDAGELSEDEAGMLVRSFLSAGIDTTVYGLGNALYCLARYPEQWQALRSDPNLIRGAFEEVLRFEAPLQTFFRTTTPARRSRRRRAWRWREGPAVLCGRQPRSAPVGAAGYVRCRPPRVGPHDLRHRYSRLRRTGRGAAGNRSNIRCAFAACRVARTDGGATAAAEQYAARL